MQKKNTILKRGLAVLLSLLVLLATAPLAFAEDESVTLNVSVDFCEGHETLAELFAGRLETEADGTVVPVTVTVDSNTVSNVISGVRALVYANELLSVLYENNGEQFYNFGLSPLPDYADEDAYDDERDHYWETAFDEDNDTLYVQWKQPAKSITVTIVPPVCGTEVSFVNNYAAGGGASSPTTSPAPEITVTGDATLFRSPFHENTDGYWTTRVQGGTSMANYEGYLEGVIAGGQSYYAAFQLVVDFGLYIADTTTILANGADLVSRGGNSAPMVASVTAVHNADLIETYTEPTCTTPGSGRYICRSCHDSYEDVIPATGHDWSAPAWSWNENNTEASANFTCSNADHPKTLEAAVAVVEEDSYPATCTTDGKITYEATVTLEGETYTDEKVVVLPATGHDYDEPVWTWSNDCSLAVLSLSCKANDVEPVRIAEISEVKTDPTATEDGAIVYTATVTVDGETYTDTKTVVLPATGTSDEPETEPQGDSLCKWCGEKHTGIFGDIVGFIHSVLYFFAHLVGAR